MKTSIMTTIGILFLLFTSCKKENISDEAINDTTWELTHIRSTDKNKKTKFPSDAENTIQLLFKADSSLLEFHGICNGGSASYSIHPNSNEIEIWNFVTTEMLCASHYEWEEYVGINITKAYKYTSSRKNLEIYTDGEYNLFFKKVE